MSFSSKTWSTIHKILVVVILFSSGFTDCAHHELLFVDLILRTSLKGMVAFLLVLYFDDIHVLNLWRTAWLV